MTHQIARRSGRPPQVMPNFVQVGDDRIISSTTWLGEERFQVLTFHDGKIVDLQGCRSRAEAERFARRAG